MFPLLLWLRRCLCLVVALRSVRGSGGTAEFNEMYGNQTVSLQVKFEPKMGRRNLLHWEIVEWDEKTASEVEPRAPRAARGASNSTAVQPTSASTGRTEAAAASQVEKRPPCHCLDLRHRPLKQQACVPGAASAEQKGFGPERAEAVRHPEPRVRTPAHTKHLGW